MSYEDYLRTATSNNGDGVFFVGDGPSSPKSKRQGSLIGYTGHLPKRADVKDGDDAIASPMEKYMIRGYTGFRPTRRSVIGEPRIPGHEKQVIIRRESFSSRDLEEYGAEVTKSPAESNATLHQFRAFAKHMDILERYNTATQQILERGQTQEQLLSIVRTKMDERALTQAMQQIRTRKLFECFDVNGDGYLDEKEFRFCLEMLNIQYDDVQSLALFAFFDYNNDGFIDWSEFAHHVLRYHK